MPQHSERTVCKSRKFAVFKRRKSAETVVFLYRQKTSLINVIGSTRTGRNTKPDREQRSGFCIARTVRCRRVPEQATQKKNNEEVIVGANKASR